MHRDCRITTILGVAIHNSFDLLYVVFHLPSNFTVLEVYLCWFANKSHKKIGVHIAVTLSPQFYPALRRPFIDTNIHHDSLLLALRFASYLWAIILHVPPEQISNCFSKINRTPKIKQAVRNFRSCTVVTDLCNIFSCLLIMYLSVT